jgi:hypothetical protein
MLAAAKALVDSARAADVKLADADGLVAGIVAEHAEKVRHAQWGAAADAADHEPSGSGHSAWSTVLP